MENKAAKGYRPTIMIDDVFQYIDKEKLKEIYNQIIPDKYKVKTFKTPIKYGTKGK